MKTDPHYFSNERPEILLHVDNGTKIILDVGCASGRLGAALKDRQKERQVIGIEHNPAVAKEARKVLDKVLVGDIQSMKLPLRKGSFDCIIFADVLEHLADPLTVLQRLKKYLRPGGYIICSIPNMRHYTVILKLLMRGWNYEEYGLFDKTHLRFFSRESMRNLIEKAGFHIEMMTPRVVASRKMRLLNIMFFGSLREFLAMQYLIKARPDDTKS